MMLSIVEEQHWGPKDEKKIIGMNREKRDRAGL